MESGRMPLPAARHTYFYVGATRNHRSRAATCADPQIGGVLRRRALPPRQVGDGVESAVRCRHFRSILAATCTPPQSRQTHGDPAGQCAVPPCEVAQGIPAQESPMVTVYACAVGT